MYNIAIYDQKVSNLVELKQIIANYQKKTDASVSIDPFMSASGLKKAARNQTYDLYFIGMNRDDAGDGESAAREIRERIPHARIALITDSDQFYKQAYYLHAVGYLTTPLDAKEVTDLLKREIRQSDKEETVLIRDTNGVVRIDAASVLYATSSDHYKTLVTDDGSYTLRCTLSELQKSLNFSYIYALTTRILFNVRKVQRVSSGKITMIDGKTFTIPRGKFNEVVRTVLDEAHADLHPSKAPRDKPPAYEIHAADEKKTD